MWFITILLSGMRQLENLNTIFNVIGKYNDHVIPLGVNGDPPIQFEVMQGQNVDTPVDLMDRMVQSAVNSTDVPYEFVQSVNQVDFATRFTMSNSKFLRKVFKRQSICQDHFTPIFLKIYNYEYGENETRPEIRLPAPAFLTMTNSQQLIENTKNFVTSISELELADDEELKPEFIRLMVRNYLGTYIDYQTVEGIITQAKHQQGIKNVEAAEDIGDDGGDAF